MPIGMTSPSSFWITSRTLNVQGGLVGIYLSRTIEHFGAVVDRAVELARHPSLQRDRAQEIDRANGRSRGGAEGGLALIGGAETRPVMSIKWKSPGNFPDNEQIARGTLGDGTR